VEWVEVTGKTVEEATERALDQLGVALGDAEVHVLSEPKTGLFGRVREEARVRARVRPINARPKRERSRRGKPNREGARRPASGSSGRSNNSDRSDDEADGGDSNGANPGSSGRSGGQDDPTRRAGARANASSGGGTGTSNSAGDGDGNASEGSRSSRSEGNGAAGGAGTSRSARRRRNRSQAGVSTAAQEGPGAATNGSAPVKQPAQQSSQGKATKETVEMAEGMTLEEQGEVGRAFLAGLLSEYGIEGSVECRLLDEETVEIAALGTDLGMLVGPRGTTLSALQDLTRAVVQRQCPSRTDRILVDVAGYREKRSGALKRFSVQIAEEVMSSGQEKALEAMSPADRKSVHDAINEMAGVVTRSEGEDPNRYIVISPAD
jgi:spoIIIJ-associated protein